MNAQPKQTNPILKLHPRQPEAKKVSVDDGYPTPIWSKKSSNRCIRH